MVGDRRERRMVVKRIILVLINVLFQRIELIVFHPYIFVPMVACLWNVYHCVENQESQTMSPSAMHTLGQLKEIIENEKKTNNGAREDNEQMQDGEELLSPDNSSSLLNTVLNTVNNKFEHECLSEAVRLLDVWLIRQSQGDWVPGIIYSIPGLPRMQCLTQSVRAVWCMVRRWVWDSDMPGAPVADDMGLCQAFS